MIANEQPGDRALGFVETSTVSQTGAKVPIWRRILGNKESALEPASSGGSTDGDDGNKVKPEKWSMGVLNDRQTDEVPGTFGAQSYPARCLLLKDLRGFAVDRGLYPRLAVG